MGEERGGERERNGRLVIRKHEEAHRKLAYNLEEEKRIGLDVLTLSLFHRLCRRTKEELGKEKGQGGREEKKTALLSLLSNNLGREKEGERQSGRERKREGRSCNFL